MYREVPGRIPHWGILRDNLVGIREMNKKSTFEPKWEGPFIIDTVYSNGAYRLISLEGAKQLMPINGKFLKKYYP